MLNFQHSVIYKVRAGTRVRTRVRATRLLCSWIMLTFAPSSSISEVETR